MVPFIGDVLLIKKPRDVIIAKFRTQGFKYQLISPPLVNEVLAAEDITGVKLPENSMVLVRDIEISASKAKRASIWCRVIECDSNSEPCINAKKRIK